MVVAHSDLRWLCLNMAAHFRVISQKFAHFREVSQKFAHFRVSKDDVARFRVISRYFVIRSSLPRVTGSLISQFDLDEHIFLLRMTFRHKEHTYVRTYFVTFSYKSKNAKKSGVSQPELCLCCVCAADAGFRVVSLCYPPLPCQNCTDLDMIMISSLLYLVFPR